MSYLTKNDAYSTLASAILASDNTIAVQPGHGDRFPVVVAPDYTKVTLEDAAGNREVIKVTARAAASSLMTVERAQEGYAARAWASGDIVELRLTSGLVQESIAHASDTTDAHTASAITNVPSGNIIATTVQAALNFLDGLITAVTSSISAHIANATGAHAASAISYAGSAGISASNVEGAIDELDTEKAPLASPALTGIPTVPTAVAGTNTTQAASTEFVQTAKETITDTATVNSNQVGYRNIPQDAKAAAYVLALTDAGKHIYYTGSAAEITFPTNAAVAFPVGSAITIVNNGSGAVTIGTTGITMYFAGTASAGNRALAVKGMATAIKVATDTWFISGVGLT